MRIAIYNWGPIHEATIDLSKPMIVLTGPNNTGKTYLSYLVFDLLRIIGYLCYSQLANNKFEKFKCLFDFSSVEKGKIVETEVNEDDVYNLFQLTLNDAVQWMSNYTGIKCDKEKFKIIYKTTKKDWKAWFESISLSRVYNELAYEKEEGSHSIKFIINSDENIRRLYFEFSQLFQFLMTEGIYVPYMLTSDRSGVYTFSKEISIGRLKAPDTGTVVRYPSPIAESLAHAENLANMRKERSQFYPLGVEIENQIIKGTLEISDEGTVNFDNGISNVEYNFSSSLVKTLTPLIFYLKYVASEHYILLLDEPEINLHPSNQVLVARVFAKMVNAGLHVMFATHSDYIIREINNLIMLSSIEEDNYIRLGYVKDESLKGEAIDPYFFKKEGDGVIVKNIPVTKTGFDVQSIDDTIEKQNTIAQDLYFKIND